ncbi:hypothetical protein GCM10023238_32080 [Streptomyces heliomycini]
MSYGLRPERQPHHPSPSPPAHHHLPPRRPPPRHRLDRLQQQPYDYTYDHHDRVIAEGGEAGHVQITLTYTGPDPETATAPPLLTTADGRSTRHLINPAAV